MTLRRLGVFALGLQLATFVCARPARAQVRITSTLLPVKAESTPARPDDMLKISANGSDPIESTSTALLSFDLRGIPQHANITGATLRLVGRSNGSAPQPQLVRITADSQTDSIGQWTAVQGETVFSAASDRLKQRIAAGVQAQQTVALRLASKSRQSDWDYYSLSETAYASSYKPRLIVEYTIPDATPELDTTTRTFWKFLPDSEAVLVRTFFDKVSPISNPAFYQGNIYLFGNPSSQETSLYGVAPGGAEQWSTRIKDKPGWNALATRTGRLYSVGENYIRLFDLQKQGANLPAVSVPGLTLDVPATLGADGSLYFVPSGNGYVYGLNPEQKELWRYPAENNAGSATVSRVTLSPVAQRYAYVLTRRSNKNTLARINAGDGSASLVTLDEKFTKFHRPVVAPEHDYVVVAAYNESAGTLSAYSDGELRWEKPGSISQPVTDHAGKKVFALQNGRFRSFDILNGEVQCSSPEPGPELTGDPNLVVDGDDNVYFWSKARLYAFKSNCERLFERSINGLPQDLELLFGPDGTLYARTRMQQIFTLTPIRTLLDLDQPKIKTDTVYTAGKLRTVGPVSLKKDMRVTFKAEKGIALSPGFSVAQGARLRCQIGL
jgi:hypothetical protein